jgi:basic amino acid/polyamine antiporter, APA family
MPAFSKKACAFSIPLGKSSATCDTNSPVKTDDPAKLVRAIGRWGLAALVVNSIIGSGIFGLPSPVAKLTGVRSPLAVLLAGAAVGIIMACFAEVASHFTETGGPYLYAREAFGRLIGLEVGWLLWLVRLTAPAANADLFTSYLAAFWPAAREPIPRLIVLTLLIGSLTVVNIRGVRGGARMSSFFTVAKLLPLAILILAGVVFLASGHGIRPATPPTASSTTWLQAVLLLVFAYGGFESGLTPMAEAKNPRRDPAFALFVALITCTVVYTLIQWVVVGVLPDPGHSERPLAEAARLMMGRGGDILVTVGALISTYGYLSANTLAVPRITFAFAEGGDFPSIFAAVHSKFRTPYFSILVFALLTWLFAVLANFSWNATLSAVARLFYYGTICAALVVLRRKQPQNIYFRLPGGTFFAITGVLICIVLATRIELSGSLILFATVTVAFINWLMVRGKHKATQAAS